MIYITTFFGLLFKFWWMILGLNISLVIGYYLYYLYSLRKAETEGEVGEKKKKKKTYEDLKPEEKFHPHDCQEKTILGIDFTEKNVTEKFPEVEKLIENLRSGEPFLLRSVEAVYIADKLSSRLVLDDNGTMTIEKDDAIHVAEIIQLDPQDLIRYILAMEKKLDPENEKTKIRLADFLYLARNARNFNLLAYGSEPEKEDDKGLVKMKTAIYNSWNRDIQVAIKDREKIEAEKKLKPESHEPEIVFENQNVASTSEEEHSTIDPVTGEVKDPSIIKVEKLDNGRVRLYTQSRKIIEKNDFEIFSYRDLVEEEEEAAAEKNKRFGIKNNVVDVEKEEANLLNTNPENVSENITPFVTTQVDLPPNELAHYESQFGKLSDEERKEFEKTRSISSLMFRSKKYYYKEFSNTISFSDELLTDNKFLTKENILNTLLQLFDVKFSQVRISTQRTLLQTIYIGTNKLSRGAEVTYRTVNVDFFLSVLYTMIKTEDKETFYKNVYNDFKNIDEEYVASIIDGINMCLDVELFSKSQGSYLVEVIYTVDSVVIKTKVLIFDAKSLNKIVQNINIDMKKTNEIYENWIKLKESIGSSIKTKVFGKNNVAKSKIQSLELGSEYFFRKKQGED